jgi:hypothetical protein
MKTNGIFLLVLLLAASCKKQYTCHCFNPGGTIADYDIRGSKKQAEDKCAEYAAPYNYPMSESGCQLK